MIDFVNCNCPPFCTIYPGADQEILGRGFLIIIITIHSQLQCRSLTAIIDGNYKFLATMHPLKLSNLEKFYGQLIKFFGFLTP